MQSAKYCLNSDGTGGNIENTSPEPIIFKTVDISFIFSLRDNVNKLKLGDNLNPL